MPASGDPTPDDFEGEPDFVCIPLIVPNKTEFKAAIYGLYGQMANPWFWKQLGTMTPETAAWLSARGLGMTDAYGECSMACEDVADCFESEIVTNTDLQNSVAIYVNQAGFGNPNHINAQTTTIPDRNTAGKMQEDVNILPSCNLDMLWGGIREGIVPRLDDLCRDLLEDLTAIPNALERLEVFIDVVPVIGDLAEGLAFQITELVPDLIDLYNSYSSESVLDEISCDIFGLVCSLCRFPTYEEIFNYYSSRGVTGMIIASTTLEELAQILIDVVSNTAEITYFTLQTFQLWVLFTQATFNGESGTNALLKFAELGEDFGSNNWLDLCDACNEAYQRMDWDLLVSSKDTYIASGYSVIGGTYIGGTGYVLQATDASAGVITVGLFLEPTWKLRAWAFQTTFTPSSLTVQLRPTRGTQTGASGRSASNGTTGWHYFENGLASITGYREFAIRIPNVLTSNQTLIRIAMIFDAGFAPPGAQPTSTNTFSGTVYP